MKTRFAGILIDLPTEWHDITEELIDEFAPTLLTLSGHLTIAVELWRGPDRPRGTPAELGMMFAEYCDEQRWRYPVHSFRSQHVFGIGCIGADDSDDGGSWMVSDGESLARVLYRSQSINRQVADELQQAVRLVRSIEFSLEEHR